MELGGIHHVTAITANAAENVRFYTEAMGLRLVKKTVNQDDVSAYHLFYGDERGSPGTEVTFFDWAHAAPRKEGTGTISEIGLRVPSRGALRWWTERFAEHGVEHDPIAERQARATLPFFDSERQRLILVAEDEEQGVGGGTPWGKSPVPIDFAIRGLSHITITVNRLNPTASMLTEAMGFRQTGVYTLAGEFPRERTVFTTGAGGLGAEVHIEVRPDLPRGRAGRGGVHHVAFRTPNEIEHERWHDRLADAGISVTPVIDRFYFKSIYFHEPGGALFEIATDEPGFTADEPLEHLGEQLALPPFLEPHRARIEAGLKPIPVEAVNHDDRRPNN